MLYKSVPVLPGPRLHVNMMLIFFYYFYPRDIILQDKPIEIFCKKDITAAA